MEGKIKELDGRLERKEREKRRRNIVIKGIKITKGKRREVVEKMMKDIGAKVKVEEIRRLKGNKEEGTQMIWVRLENAEQRRKVMERKKRLRGRKERIVEDLTWKERKMRWKLEDIARMEERRGKRVWVGYGKIRINDQ